MKKLIIFIFFTLFLFSCSEDEEIVLKKYFGTGVVFTGSINNHDTYVGYLEGEDETQLSTKVGGKVSNIYVEVGDYVNAGDLLLTLDSNEAKVGYNTSSDILSKLNDLKISTSFIFDEQIKAMQEKLNQTNIGKTGIYTGLDDTKNISLAQLETALIGLETAKVNLENTKILLDTKEKNIYTNSKNAVVSSVILDTNIITYLDELLGVTDGNKGKNDSFEIYLGAKKSSKYIEAKNQFLVTNELYKKYKKLYNDEIESKKPSDEILLQALNSGEHLAESFKVLLNLTYEVLENSIDNVSLTKETIDSYKASIINFGSSIESSLLTVSGDYILGLKGSIQSLTDFQNQKILQIDLLKKQVELAEKTYNQYKVTSDSKIREVSTQTQISDSQVQEVSSGIESLKKQKQAKLEELDLKIKETLGQRDISGVMIDSGEIRSPISGIITSKMAEIGQVVGGGVSLFIVADDRKMKLNILVSEDSLKNITLGKEILLDVDGFDKQEKAKVSKIYPSKDLITKNTNIEISFVNKNKLKIGTYTKVFLSTINNFDDILIPNNAIISKYMVPGVFVLNKDGIISFKNIEILGSNDKFAHISGLLVGDTIITTGKENLFDGEKIN